MYCIEESTCRAGPSRCGAQCKSYARGVSEQWCYDVIVLIQPCYDLFDEDVLSKSKTVAMYAHDKQFLLFVGEWAVLPLTKLYTEQMFVLLRTKRMQLRNHADKTQRSVPSVKRAMRYIYTYSIHTVLNLECCKCARMGFHWADGLVLVLRDYAAAHLRGDTGREHSYCVP